MIDLGVAFVERASLPDLTMDGSVVGTPLFMARERLRAVLRCRRARASAPSAN